MNRLTLITAFLLVTGCRSNAQPTITGAFPDLAHQQVDLVGFAGFTTYPIASTTVSTDGYFKVPYAESDFGMGYLMAEDNRPFFVVLSGEDIHVTGKMLALLETIEVLQGEENRLFAHYAAEHPKREQALNAWIYLRTIYDEDALFASQGVPRQAIAAEITRLQAEDARFIDNLDATSYLRWYLPVRKLISSVPALAQFRTDEIPAAIAAFRALDHTDPRLYKSGLFKEALESHFWLLENSGRSLEAVFVEMNVSIDHLMEKLAADEVKRNEITGYLFDLLERHSLFAAAEHLALSVLEASCCSLDLEVSRKLETYRAMSLGRLAADIAFTGHILAPGYPADTAPRRLSEVESDYTVVVFGASWCPQCTGELQALAAHYPKWKAQGVEVVLFSLDEEKSSFEQLAGAFPFLSTCDYQQWDTEAVQKYYVSAIPTLYLLDNQRKILLRPTSVRQLDAWVDFYLVQGNR